MADDDGAIPGTPWTVGKSWLSSEDAGLWFVEGVAANQFGHRTAAECYSEKVANLISAAPDMLAAIENALQADAIGSGINVAELCSAFQKANGLKRA